MTIMEKEKEKRLFAEGRDLYCHYLRSGGVATLKPVRARVVKMARELDLSVDYVLRCLDMFLNH